jgi:hypothetical protein
MPSPARTQPQMKALVEDFFAHNYRDITSRETLEWGDVAVSHDGKSSIRYKYRAKIWDRDTVTNEQVFTFDRQGKFVSVEDLTKAKPGAGAAASPASATDPSAALLNDDQRAVLAWTDRQFRSVFDYRTFEGWTDSKRAELEAALMDTLKGPLTREYYQAINTLAALRSTNAMPRLREIAFDRADKNCRDRWMAIRALGLIGDRAAVPELIHLVYHGNQNTRWWAQITLVRLTGQNLGRDWNAWGKWWNQQGGQPPFQPEVIRWWSGQPEPDQLAQTLEENDRTFLEGLNK